MDERLVEVLGHVARRFSAGRIEVVSGYRSPKYNLMLRKKGREVARTSQHSEGNAVDFRLRGIPTRRLLNFVRSLQDRRRGLLPPLPVRPQRHRPHPLLARQLTGPTRPALAARTATRLRTPAPD